MDARTIDDTGPKYEAIAIGVSAGGVHALNQMLPSFPAGFRLPIVIVQHVYPHAESRIVGVFDGRCNLHVKEAEEKEAIQPGTVYFAPPNYHLLIEEDCTFSLTTEERVNFARPSVDVLFDSASDVYGSRLVGVVMTGANQDGSAGLRRIKERGGLAVVQDPQDAEADVMPKAALKSTAIDYVLTLAEMGPFLAGLGGFEPAPKRKSREDNP